MGLPTYPTRLYAPLRGAPAAWICWQSPPPESPENPPPHLGLISASPSGGREGAGDFRRPEGLGLPLACWRDWSLDPRAPPDKLPEHERDTEQVSGVFHANGHPFGFPSSLARGVPPHCIPRPAACAAIRQTAQGAGGAARMSRSQTRQRGHTVKVALTEDESGRRCGPMPRPWG